MILIVFAALGIMLSRRTFDRFFVAILAPAPYVRCLNSGHYAGFKIVGLHDICIQLSQIHESGG
jgi:hypothetical protein